jgi:4-amino-4-deoxy-L-arabinose transferase-like glycosyltransferase
MDVVSDNEGQRVTPPAEMLRSGDFVIPTINGVEYLTKPPLLYWAIALSYSLTGSVSAWSARVPGALCAAGLVVAVYLACRREAGETAARWAALGLLASPYFLERARWAHLDVPLTLTIFLAVMALRAAASAAAPRRGAVLVVGAGLAFAAAILLKGPVPFIYLWVAWVAHAVLSGKPGRAPRPALYGSLALVGLDFALSLLQKAWTEPPGWLTFPYALIAAVLLWTVVAWRCAGSNRTRDLGLWVTVAVTGTLLAAPWAVAVVARLGWADIGELLHTQVLERTHTASRINSGSVVYYVVALPALLAPWGLLLPFHLSRKAWQERPGLYRYGIAVGWLSVLVFSLIEGKEYEYVLPAAPFLLIATAFPLAGLSKAALNGWMAKWGKIWQLAMLALLGVAGPAIAVHATLSHPHPILLTEVWILSLATVAAALCGLRLPRRRLACLAAVTLTAMLSGLFVRGFDYTGDKSPQAIARVSGRLVRDGFTVEASKVYPQFAFYAEATIPQVVEESIILERLNGPDPYFFLTRESLYKTLVAPRAGPSVRLLMGPHTRKKLVLIGNRRLGEAGVTDLQTSSGPSAQRPAG